MWRPSRQVTGSSAYQSDARYNPQPTEDQDASLKNTQPSHVKRPNYKPTALRWYFIVCQIVLLSAMIAIVAYASLRMPDSDSTAVIDEGPTSRGLKREPYGADGYGTLNLLSRWDTKEGPTPVLVARLDEPSVTSLSPSEETLPDAVATLGPTELQSLQDQSVSLSAQAEQEKGGKRIDIAVTRDPCGTSTICVSSVTTNVIITIIVPETTQTLTITSSSISTTVVPVVTTTVIPGETFTNVQPTIIKETTQVILTTVLSASFTFRPNGTETAVPTPVVGSAPPTTKTITKSSTKSVEVPVVTTSLTVRPEETYFDLGPTVIEVTYTPAARAGGSPQQMPVTHIVTTVEPGRTVTDVVRQAPVRTVVGGEDRVETRLVQQGPELFVTRVGGSVTNVVVVVTPSPLSENEDSPKGPSDFVDKAGDGGEEFQPMSLTMVSEMGGGLQIFTIQDSPQTAVITHADGSLETVITTPPLWLTTSRVDVSLTTFAITTTPTGSEPISFTVVSTIRGTLTTMTTTPSASKVVTTISGTLSTITSTPSPSTRTSTIDGTTKTLESIATPDPTPTVPETELKEYNVNTAKSFLGKFLPTLLATILAIPLRIIDLNAKLYQPFYAFNAENGALGAQSMTLHFSGLNAFTKPFSLLLGGHPIPLVTSLILWSSSLTVPLAAEALGLKIHGRCQADSIKGCALDLGVSPGPTRALIAVLALIVVLLVILLVLAWRRESGLHANPWSIAGIASLARCRDVRVRNSKEADIHREVAEKRYSFGFFRNEEGRAEYGIVLYDDAGRNLREDQDPESRDGADHAEHSTRRDTNSAAQTQSKGLPFMALGYPWRIAFLVFLLGLFVVVLFYHISVLRGTTSRFKAFMNSHNFGARFLFAGVGVVITFAWLSFFVSMLAPSLFL